MNNSLLVSFLIAHFLGDYYFQNEWLALKKKDSLRHLLLHFVFYSLAYLPLLLIYGQQIFIAIIYLQVLHAAIDSVFYIYNKKKLLSGSRFLRKMTVYNSKKNEETRMRDFYVYFLDQSLHIITIILIFTSVSLKGDGGYVYFSDFGDCIINIFIMANIDYEFFTKLILSFILIHKPMNVFIAKFLSGSTPKIKVAPKNLEQKEIQESDKNAGRYIGSLERLLILIFLLMNQYTAIGFVLTAKSLTRYHKIVEEPDFGEYYLLGTLLSFLLILLSTIALF